MTMSDCQMWQSLMYLWNKYPIVYGLKEELAERIAFWGGSVEMAELELGGER